MTKSKAQLLKDIEILIKEPKSLLESFYKLNKANLNILTAHDLMVSIELIKKITANLQFDVNHLAGYLKQLKGGQNTKQNGKR